MVEKVSRKLSKKVSGEAVEFTVSGLDPLSSPTRAAEIVERRITAPALAESVVAKPAGREYSREFLELAEPKLPALSKGNRARLLMQSPNRLYFYWFVGKNPFHTLNRALGESTGYALVLKLVNLRTGYEEIHAVDSAGNWWFSVDADAEYRAEIGFYAVNRPYIRVLYSNTVTTPRKSPSPRTADTAEWRVPADKFARVLDAAGFARDAFDVALAGDDWNAADTATRSAFARFTGKPDTEFSGIASEEIRYAMLALASGVPLQSLRGLISDRLFALLSGTAGLTGEQALAALKDKFEFDADEFEIEEAGTEAVFGASLVNFPKKLKKTRKLPGLQPISSHSLVR